MFSGMFMSRVCTGTEGGSVVEALREGRPFDTASATAGVVSPESEGLLTVSVSASGSASPPSSSSADDTMVRFPPKTEHR